jgi:hypothetical protein
MAGWAGGRALPLERSPGVFCQRAALGFASFRPYSIAIRSRLRTLSRLLALMSV